MREAIADIYGHLRGAWKYRWYMLVISWLVCLAGWFYVANMPDEYEASAKVYVDTNSVLQPLLRGLMVSSSTSAAEAEVITRTLVTRPNIEKLIQMTDLDLTVHGDDELEALISSIQSRIKLDVDKRRRDLYQISFSDESPEQAKRVVQALLTIFVESSLGESRKGGDVAQVFLDEQIAEYERKLLDAEDRLRDFKQRNVGLMPSEGGGYYGRLQAAKDQLESSKLELSEADRRRRMAEQQLESAKNSLESNKSTEILTTSVDERLNAMRERLDGLLLKYTDAHPNVQAVKAALEELEAQREAELAELGKSGAIDSAKKTTLDDNPVYQQLQLTLADSEIETASLRERVRQYQERVDQLTEMVNTIPEVEAEFKKLNRNYDIYKNNYDELVAKRESAQISEDASRSEDDVTFKVVEPPYAATDPVGPQRELLASAILIAGLVAGALFAYLMTQLRPTFESHRDLIEITRCPVLGYVSKIQSRSEIIKRRAEISLFVMAIGVLLVAFGIIQLMGVKL